MVQSQHVALPRALIEELTILSETGRPTGSLISPLPHHLVSLAWACVCVYFSSRNTPSLSHNGLTPRANPVMTSLPPALPSVLQSQHVALPRALIDELTKLGGRPASTDAAREEAARR